MKIEGDFVWYSYVDIDEIFIVFVGCLCIDFCDGVVYLGFGEMYVVLCGVEYKLFVEGEVCMFLVEFCGVCNIGD